MKVLQLTEIWIYPIKSLGGIRLDSAKVLGKGLEFDRRWMLIDQDGVFMTQRTYPQMAMFKLELAAREIKVTKKNASANGFISFSADAPAIGKKIRTKVFDDAVDVIESGTNLSEWFSYHLQVSCRLVSFPESNPRTVDPKYKVNDEHVSLADGYPFLIIGQSSLDDLNARLESPIPMNRFRPNFVFTGGEPFEEDTWREFTIGENQFVGVKPCGRCAIPTVNQETAEKGIEPTYTLSTFRKQEAKILFGQNLVAIDNGTVKTGDKILIK
jgi:uncharacterized protein YcbX